MYNNTTSQNYNNPGYNQNSYQSFQNSIQKLKEKPNNFIISNMMSNQKGKGGASAANFEETEYFKTINKLTEKCYELKSALEKQREREKVTQNDIQNLKSGESFNEQKFTEIVTEITNVKKTMENFIEKQNSVEQQLYEIKQIMNLCQQGIQDYSEFKLEFSQI